MASGTMIYQGQAGHTYTFLALATDVAGNHELPPANANVPQNTTTANLGALPTVPNTTPPNFGIPPAPTVQPSTNPLFTQAQQGVPAAPPASNPSEFMTVLQPFQAQSFATGFAQSDGILGPMAIAEEPDGSFLISGGPSRNELFHVNANGGQIGAPLATLPYQIFALAFDNQGHLWATTGGGPLLQLDPSTGAIVNQFGERITLALAVDPKTDQIFVATNNGVSIFDPTTDTFTQYSRDQNLRVSSLAFDNQGNLWAVTWPDCDAGRRVQRRGPCAGDAHVRFRHPVDCLRPARERPRELAVRVSRRRTRHARRHGAPDADRIDDGRRDNAPASGGGAGRHAGL